MTERMTRAYGAVSARRATCCVDSLPGVWCDRLLPWEEP